MAGVQLNSASYTIPVTSYDTALCVLPPIQQCEHVNGLRELYDKAYGRWPAHINLIYPFVAPERLPEAQQQIQAHFGRNLDTRAARRVKLDSAGLFRQRHNSTAIVQESRESSDGSLESLRALALQALGHEPSQHNFHLTAGQTEDNSMASLNFLISKVRLLPALNFEIGSLAILVRERTSSESSPDRMHLWGSIDLCSSDSPNKVTLSEHWLSETPTGNAGEDEYLDDTDVAESATAFNRAVQPGKTFCFDVSSRAWIQATPSQSSAVQNISVTVSSYNVLVDSEYPPARDRDPLLISTLLSEAAQADIVALQEVSDDFLSSLLKNAEIQKQFPFTSHGPPSQPGIGPLPSLRNVVIISKWPFTWELVPFHRRHKGAVVAVFKSNTPGGSLAVAGIHLTCGLTDGSVAAKKVQVHNLLTHLSRQYNDSPWIITGDFNLATSTHTIDSALKNKYITAQTGQTLALIEERLADGTLDAWSSLRADQGLGKHELQDEELFDGEQGATFDPRNNVLAAATSGTSQNRPQRYDRILYRPLGSLRATAFNMFGLPADKAGESVVPSDHYGVRASLQISKPAEELTPDHRQMLKELNVEVQHVSHLAPQEMQSTLRQHGMFLTDEEKSKRQSAFNLLKEVVLGDSATGDIPLVMVAVGSFAMKVDTSSSDIDCLCIGSISSATFFKLTRQRLQKAESRGILLLRKVEAGTGTMLELSVDGVPMDLQYCPAARVAERWSDLESLPASDPVFNLPILSLRKLKPYRDMIYIQRTTPDPATFDLAYRAIKLWATQRGVYSSKFGYLGGVHITLMLSWVYKRAAHEVSSRALTPSDLVVTFFHYYAHFDWADDMVYDAFFHTQKPRYHRTKREPMVVLGFHAPNANVAHSSTVPGLAVLRREFEDARARLSDVDMTWDRFFSQSGSDSLGGLGLGEAQFLQAYKHYVSIDIQFWGRTLGKGKGLVGWVESRCVWLVVDMHRLLPDMDIRLWPARFTHTKPSAPSETTDYHGCYLIGLQHRPAPRRTPSERHTAKHALEKTIDTFLASLRADTKNYDPTTSYLNASLTTIHPKTLHPDPYDWGIYATDLDPDSDSDSDEAALDAPTVPRLAPRRKPNTSPTPVSTSKLRPATDVLHRLRWDPCLDPAAYVIGYLDRFLGVREIGLMGWKTEKTDEEFIPQHRILYFRRKGEGGEVVWERATRVDRVFGSGVGVFTGSTVA